MTPRVTIVIFAAALWAAPWSARAGDAERGRGLYELRCGGCHTESVHGRAKRVARSMDDVRRWVRRWNENLKLRWGDEEVEDVAAYLNATYYHFSCEAPPCRALSMAR